MSRSNPLFVVLTALAPVSWGTTYLTATEFLPPDRPLFTATMRALPAGLLLLAATRKLPRGDWWWKAAVLGILNFTVFFPMLFLSAYRLPGGTAAVVAALAPLVVAGFSVVLLGERFTLRTLVAGIAVVVGVGLVVLASTVALDPVGVAAALVGTVAMSAGNVLTKRWRRPDGVNTFAFLGWQLTAGGLLLVPLALVVEGAPPALDGRAVGGFLYLVFPATLVAYWMWIQCIGRLTVTQVTFLGPLSPITATLLGWYVLGESLEPVQLAGMVLALGAILLGQRAPRPPRDPAPAPPPTGDRGPGLLPAPAQGEGAR